MADIITRLLLKTNDFDANLNKAKGSVNQFQGGISNMAKTAGAGIMKFAGTLGIAIGATEGFMKVVRGSQTASDEFDTQIRICETSVNEFFSSLSTGDFTYFLGGLDGIAQKARDANAALDQLGNARISYDYFKEAFNADISDGRMNALDRSLSKKERLNGFSTWKKAIEEKEEKANSVKDDTLDALKKVLVEGNRLNSEDITLEDFETVLSYDVAGNKERAELKRRMAQMYDQYRVKTENLEKRRDSGGISDLLFPESESTQERAAYNKELDRQQEELNKEFKEAILFNQAIVKWKDEELINAKQLGKEYKQINRELSMDRTMFNKAKYRFENEKEDKPDAKPAPPPVGSLSALDAEISKQNKKLAEATMMQARAAVQATINELEQQKINLKVVVDQEAFKIKHGEMKGGSLGTPGSIYSALQNNAGNKKQGSFDLREELKDMKLPKFKSPIKKADISLNEEYADSLNSIGSIMGSLSGTFDGGAASVLQWGASILSTIAQVIPQLIALTTANETETTSEVAGAAAKTMNAHAKIPFVGIAMGLAGVASIFSVMSQAGKFATGGIVPGNSFTGDKVPAWVNSGEMILNSEQQGNLFKMLNSKLYGGLNIGRPNIEPQTGNIAALIAPGDNGRDIRVSGDIKVKGSDLYLSLDNYKKKTGKR